MRISLYICAGVLAIAIQASPEPTPIERQTSSTTFATERSGTQFMRLAPGLGESMYARQLFGSNTLYYWETRVSRYEDAIRVVIRDRQTTSGSLAEVQRAIESMAPGIGQSSAVVALILRAADDFEQAYSYRTDLVETIDDDDWYELSNAANQDALQGLRELANVLAYTEVALRLGDAVIGGVLLAALTGDLAVERLAAMEAAMRQRNDRGEAVDPAFWEALDRTRRALQGQAFWQRAIDAMLQETDLVRQGTDALADVLASFLPPGWGWVLRSHFKIIELRQEQIHWVQSGSVVATLNQQLKGQRLGGLSEYHRRYLELQAGYQYFNYILTAMDLRLKADPLTRALRGIRDSFTGGEAELRQDYERFRDEYGAALDALENYRRHLSISGPVSVDDNNEIQFTAILHFAEDISEDVTGEAEWEISGSGPHRISLGSLSAADIVGDQVINIAVQLQGVRAEQPVTIRDTAPAVDPATVPDAPLFVDAPGDILGGMSAQLRAYVGDDMATWQDVTADATWRIVSGPATVSSSGLLSPQDVTEQSELTVSATWSGRTATGIYAIFVNRPLAFFRDLDMSTSLSAEAYIKNSGRGTLVWQAHPRESWVRFEPSQGVLPEGNVVQPIVTVDRYGWEPGVDREAAVDITVSGKAELAANGRTAIVVSARALPPSAVVSPAAVDLGTEASLGRFVVSMSPRSGGELSFSVASDADWLSLSPTVGGGRETSVRVEVERTTLGAGNHLAQVTVSAGTAGSRTVAVSVVVPSRSPSVHRLLPDLHLEQTAQTYDRDLLEAPLPFSDTIDDTLTFSAWTSKTDVVRVTMAGSVLSITPQGPGLAEVTVVARDQAGDAATQVFTVMVVESTTTAVVGDANSLPVDFALHQPYPNPFNGTVVIRYDVPSGQPVDLTVYNTAGQTVVRLVDGLQQPGFHEARWLGVDRMGQPVASGIYVVELRGKEWSRRRTVTLLR